MPPHLHHAICLFARAPVLVGCVTTDWFGAGSYFAEPALTRLTYAEAKRNWRKFSAE
jgi:hypothetical protein